VSALFFVISELASIEPMYQYSLAWFVALFEDTLAKADKARDLGKRIENLVAHFQYSLYVQVRVQGWHAIHRHVASSVQGWCSNHHATDPGAAAGSSK
jgi:hypothetical protein